MGGLRGCGGQEHLGKNDYDRAGYYVDRVVPQCPDAPAVMIMRADLLIGRGKYDDAGSICWVRFLTSHLLAPNDMKILSPHGPFHQGGV